MKAELVELYRFRELLAAMVERELKIRYKNSFLGFFWSLVNPLVTVMVMWLVFKLFLRNGTENYSAYVLSAYIPFMFVNLAILDSAQSIIAALPVVKKVYFPREILPLASVIANFIHFILAMTVFFGFLLAVWASTGFTTTPFTWRITFLPVLMLVSLSLATGVALIVSALNVYYEDVKYVMSVFLYLAFFLTPIMYFSENVWYALRDKGSFGQFAFVLFHLNPVAMLATAYKKTLVPPGPIDVGGAEGTVAALQFDWALFSVTCVVSVVCLVGGYALFNRLKWGFVERP
ncbi:MAG: ABC transporter permease [Fimbriimonadaceae bacterium]|nr:ABC transporter permease [Fimbriimonadaceae bacterium]QYK54999.1 MAG: ABC transporter permease [Fimbriimonadaceae bacterium]